MALIAITTADTIRVVESIEQMTLPAAEDIAAGDLVRLDTTNGKFTKGNGTSTTEAALYGISPRKARAGEAVTAIRKGVLDGFTFSQNYWAPIYASDTDGRLGDAAGTVSKIVGRIIPGTAVAVGAAYSKLLLVDMPL